MSDSLAGRLPAPPRGTTAAYGQQGSSANLADILERVLDKGVVIAGDIRINLLDIELLTIKLRLLVASVDKAKEMGIDWWEHDPSLSSRARPAPRPEAGPEDGALAEENERLRAELARLRSAAGLPGAAAAEGQPAPAAEEEAR
ncbi:gas vesicle protein [Streptomyces sp. NBC_00525]|uniref:gas vesicle protein n=1 Tax=Streptomyces sp. NBC_00525 TaxID=2903660 RepID=UPI002E812E7A|nr:gas vesicle protein [Streptomyces sp. NBC_00525]WUC93451.1 gas vesicle protein [Streptomyces sp. NBC_00525]